MTIESFAYTSFIFWPLLIVALGIHESAHIITGMSMGWRFYHTSIGPLGIRLDNKGVWSFYFVRDIRLWGGSVAISHKDAGQADYRQVFAVVMAGPMVSLGASLVLLAIGHFLKDFHLSFLGIISAGVFLLTVLPYRIGFVYSDGGRCRRLIQGGQVKEIEMATFRIGSKVLFTHNYRDIDLSDAHILQTSNEIIERYFGHYCAYRYYTDREMATAADDERKILLRMEKHIPANVRRYL